MMTGQPPVTLNGPQDESCKGVLCHKVTPVADGADGTHFPVVCLPNIFGLEGGRLPVNAWNRWPLQ